MLDVLRYVNNRGEALDMGAFPYFININDLRDYQWTYDTINNKPKNFRKTLVEKTLPLVVFGDADDIDRVYRITDADIQDDAYGYLEIGEYRMNCRISAAKYSDYLVQSGYVLIELTVIAPYPVWLKNYEYQFLIDSHTEGTSGYPYGYPYDYSPGGNTSIIDLDSDSGFIMNIYGPVINPSVTIGGHLYQVNTPVLEGEVLTITAANKQKTIMKSSFVGSSNEFKNRNTASSVFEPIKHGKNVVVWDGTFRIDLTVVEERGTPSWS